MAVARVKQILRPYHVRLAAIHSCPDCKRLSTKLEENLMVYA